MTRDDLIDEQLESRLRTALQSRAKAVVPDARPLPPLLLPGGPGRTTGQTRAWLTPLAAAAAVLVVAGGIAGSQLLARPATNQPATTGSPIGTAAASTGQVTVSTTPTAGGAGSSSPTGSGSVAITPTTQRHDLGGGIVLDTPAGWRVSSGAVDYNGPTPVWCLTAPGSTGCTAVFSVVDAQLPVDVELEGGMLSNPQYCDAADPAAKRTTKASTTATFGGRQADYRWWHWTCSSSSFDIAQYVVASPPGFVLFSDRADQSVRTALAQIAGSSTLPAATAGGLRFNDQGTVVSATRVADGVDITLDRMIGTYINDWTSAGLAPVRYHLPSSAQGFSSMPADLTRQRLQLFTDGSTVTQVIFPGG